MYPYEDFPEVNPDGNVIERAVVLEDTGFAKVPEQLFVDIPDQAVVNIMIIRSNYDYFTLNDGKQFRSSVGTHLRVPAILTK